MRKLVAVSALVFVLGNAIFASGVSATVRKKVWVPQVTNSEVHDSGQAVAKGNENLSGWVPGSGSVPHTGVTTPDDGVAIYAYGKPGFNKKVEVQAVVNKGVRYSDGFAWYQRYRGSSSDQDGVIEDTLGAWKADNSGNPMSPVTYHVDGAKTLYLYDSPGFTFNYTAAHPYESLSWWFRYQDRIYWKGPKGWKDVVRVSGSPWLPSDTGWTRRIDAHKNDGSTHWIATSNQ